MSRNGLGLTEARFWASTPKEYEALREVWEEAIERTQFLNASIQATLYNAHFETGGVPWTPDEVMGKGDRAGRKQRALKDRMSLFKAMSPTGDIPELFRDKRKPN